MQKRSKRYPLGVPKGVRMFRITPKIMKRVKGQKIKITREQELFEKGVMFYDEMLKLENRGKSSLVDYHELEGVYLKRVKKHYLTQWQKCTRKITATKREFYELYYRLMRGGFILCPKKGFLKRVAGLDGRGG